MNWRFLSLAMHCQSYFLVSGERREMCTQKMYCTHNQINKSWSSMIIETIKYVITSSQWVGSDWLIGFPNQQPIRSETTHWLDHISKKKRNFLIKRNLSYLISYCSSIQNSWMLNELDSPKYWGTNLDGAGGRLGSIGVGSESARGSSIAPSIEDSGLSMTLEARLVDREPLTSDIYSNISSLSLRWMAISPFSLVSCLPVRYLLY